LADDSVIDGRSRRTRCKPAAPLEVSGDDAGQIFRRLTTERRDSDGNTAVFNALGNVDGLLRLRHCAVDQQQESQ
jgi:hypothetical protein